MKSVSAGLASHLAGEVTTLATCWKATLRDGTVFGFTDHDRDLTVDGLTYQAASGYTASAIASNAELSVDNLNLAGVLDADAIDAADILAGRWNFATVEIFAVNHQDTSQGALKLRRGVIGEVSLHRSRFTAELRGMTQPLQQNVGELYSAGCRAALGDARCGVTLGDFTASGTVTGVTDARRFADSGLGQSDGYFDFGLVTWVTGDNAGLAMEVKSYTTGAVVLQLAMPYAIAVGDTFTISAGCDKTIATCRDRFSNAVNFRGEPYLPGIDQLSRGPA